MYYRRKILLSLLNEFGGNLKKTDMQKLLFLFCQRQENSSYYFVPYKYGSFSFQSYADKRTLTKYGLLNDSDNWKLTDLAKSSTFDLKKNDKNELDIFKEEYKDLKGQGLVKETYLKFPYYAIKSEILNKVLNNSEQKKIEELVPNQKGKAFFTIGYEGISLEQYLNILIKKNVKLLCDVRKNPLSMKFGFSKNQLKNACNKIGIEYLHIPELGISSEKRVNLDTQEDYNKLFDEYDKTTLVDEYDKVIELTHLINKYNRIAITCFEETASKCHRSRVANAVSNIPEWNIPITHI
ncbi:MAG: DUF488 family protein [Planctomycetia bacterium]|nr:DUF488 family protein [Planctomycetia bacterium]